MTETPAVPPSSLFEALYRVEFPRLVAIARRIVANTSEAEDIAQEALLAFARSRPYDDPSAASWLRAAVAHGALNSARKRRRRVLREQTVHRLQHPLDQAADSLRDPVHAILCAEQHAEIQAAMRTMRRRDAALLALRFGGDLSYQEIADALHLPPNQIGTLLTRAERALALRLDPRRVRRSRIAVALIAAAAISLSFFSAPVRAWAGAVIHHYVVQRLISGWTTPATTRIDSEALLARISTSRYTRRPVVAPVAATVSEASRRAGFTVRVPRSDDALGDRELDVDPGWSKTWILSRQAAARYGYQLPQRLEGATITVDTGTIVQIRYGHGTVAAHLPWQPNVLVIDEARAPRVDVRGAGLEDIAHWYASVPGLSPTATHALSHFTGQDLTLNFRADNFVSTMRNGTAFVLYGTYSQRRLAQIAATISP